MNNSNWQAALNTFIDSVRVVHQNDIAEIILYGSRARGDAEWSSDIDLLVIVNAPDDKLLIEEICTTVANKVSLEYDLVISVIVLSEKQYQQSYEPLVMNVRREGKRVA